MSTTKHTPGPWTVDVLGSVTAMTTSGIRQVALATGDAPMLDVRTELPPEEIRVANAKLIAAAPDMLAALKRMLNTGLNGGDNVRLAFIAAKQDALDAKELAEAEASEQAVNAARAAIAKAEGRS